jgi:hypothetical protein
MLIRLYYACLFLIGLFGTSLTLAVAAEQVHLLGFVENLCPDEPYCFELRVEADYVTLTDESISVRYKQVTTIFDPENYELTLEQSNIIPGSHLRLLLTLDPERAENDYRANYIWIGD